jgi:hypothetical protein
MSLTIPGTGPLVLPTGTTLLADPAQFDVTSALASTAFVQQALGNIRGSTPISSGPITLGPSHWGKRLELQIGAAVTLPLASSVPQGTSVLITTNLGASTITTTGGNLLAFNNQAVTVPYTISNGGTFLVTSDGSVWRAQLGSEELRTSPMFGSQLALSGYQKIPSGFIIQWGTFNVPASTTSTLTFPIQFTTACYVVTANFGVTGAGTVNASPVSATQYQIQNTYSGGSQGGSWIAIGK